MYTVKIFIPQNVRLNIQEKDEEEQDLEETGREPQIQYSINFIVLGLTIEGR